MRKNFKVDSLEIEILDSPEQIGYRASEFVVGRLRRIISQKGTANLILATGASQFEFLQALKSSAELDWSKITVFHLDEYLGMSDTHPASFRKYLQDRILDAVKPARVFLLKADARDIEAELSRYENLLLSNPVDIACIGIGENGHIAFNDPAEADFSDPRMVKVVQLDELCRKQQLGEGWFASLDEVPTHALSLTIPTIMKCRTISSVVPDARKADAVYNTVHGPVTTEVPASILRTHADTTLFLDRHSSAKLTL
jgi:glucosamine-6-phosphate deaminase